MPELLKFDLPKNQSNIIKVIGVGGGGSNAVTHMFHQGITGVDFIIANTDAQAMESTPIPSKIQIGTNLTGGLGAGAVPSVGRNAALENTEEIRGILSKGTKMLFITAGLGGGTGTGAAPVIAQISKELGILTVGIVTIPFMFEGRKRKLHADEGIRQLKQHVDALVIISNDKLRELYGDLKLSEAFARADNVLTTAAKGIAEIITVAGYINVDFEDVKTVMRDSGVAIMGTGVASGADRARKSVEDALNSPLLNNNDIEGANNLLLYISSGKEEITMDEVTEITDYIQLKTKSSTEVIWGNGFDESLGDQISVTIIATGFDEEHKQNQQEKNIIPLYNTRQNASLSPSAPEQTVLPILPKTDSLLRTNHENPEKKPDSEEETSIPEPSGTREIKPVIRQEIPLSAREKEPSLFDHECIDDQVCQDDDENTPEYETEPSHDHQREVIFDLNPPAETPEIHFVKDAEQEPQPTHKIVATFPEHVQPKPLFTPAIRQQPEPDQPSGLQKIGSDRVQKLRALSEKLKNHTPIENNLSELENIPAYKRRNIPLSEVSLSSESQVSRYTLSENENKDLEIKSENSYLHKNVD